MPDLEQKTNRPPASAAGGAEGKNEAKSSTVSPETSQDRLFQETVRKLEMIRNRELFTVKNMEQMRKETGWFGSFHRFVTLSDPYAIEIQKARNTAATAEYAKSFVAEAQEEKDPAKRAELLNQARRLAGLREVDEKTFLVRDEAPKPSVLNKVDLDQSHFKLEQEAISVSRNVAMAAGSSAALVMAPVIAGGLAATGVTGTGAAATGVAAKVGMPMLTAALTTAELSGAAAYDDVKAGLQTPKQAVKQVGTHVAVATALAGFTSLVLPPVFGALARRGKTAPAAGAAGGRAAGEVEAGLKVNGPEIKQILESPPLPKSAPAAEAGLKVNGSEMDRILNAPRVTNRNAVPRAPSSESELVGASGPAKPGAAHAGGEIRSPRPFNPQNNSAPPGGGGSSVVESPAEPQVVVKPGVGNGSSSSLSPKAPLGRIVEPGEFFNMLDDPAITSSAGFDSQELRRAGWDALYKLASQESPHFHGSPDMEHLRRILVHAFEKFVKVHPPATSRHYWY